MLIAAASSLLCFPENPTGFSANPWLFCSANPAAMQQYFRQMSARQPYFCHMSAFTWKYFVRFYSEYFPCKTSPHFRQFKSWLEQRSEDEEILIFAPKLFPAKNSEGKKIFWHANSNFNNLSLEEQPASQMLARCFFTTPLMVPQCAMYMTCTVYNMNNVHWTCTITLSASSTVHAQGTLNLHPYMEYIV